jgi:Fe(3+) dicitrate transport protein
MIRFAILILFAFLAVSAAAQEHTATIHGTVTSSSGQYLIGVNVMVEGLRLGATTDVKGRFVIANVARGRHTLKLSSVGYETHSVSIEVTGAEGMFDVQLKERLYELPEIVVERETMTGGSQFVHDVPGSAHYIGPQQLDKFSYNDVNRVLRNIPGLNIQEEEGFGLRPNIGMRGTGVERTSKITIMEDGILAAPAPYVAPAAYYFPTVGRMQGVEVRKGSSQIKYGPYTTGGAINFISTPVPQTFSARVNLTGGNYGRRVALASVGQSFDYGGFLLETFQNSAAGFKKLDNGGPTGFDSKDYLMKVRVNTPAHARIYQSLTFKVAQSTGDSEETYLGLTQRDFEKTPYRRYAASQMDFIKTSHEQYSVKYNIIPARFMDVSVIAYRNNFSRNWYKLDGVKFADGSEPAPKFIPIASVLDNPAQYANEMAILTGTSSPNADALSLRNNNRGYYAKGIQSIIGLTFSQEKIKHDVELGFRYHLDQEDRFQWEDRYSMDNGVMKLTQRGTPGSQDNRIGDAKAIATYVQYTMRYNKLLVMPGIRYENMELARTNYGKTDPGRTGADVKRNANNVDLFIPGIGVEYDFTPNVHSFLGVHRGFSPPGSSEGTRPENSVNYEVGSRFVRKNTNVQVLFFFNDYENLLGSDLAAAGGGGTGDQFNAGKTRVYGAEVEMSYYWIPAGLSQFGVPVTLAYTFNDGEFGKSFHAINEDWGTVEKGDRLPYLSNHQLTVNAGLDHKAFNVNLSTRYVGAMRTSPGRGAIPDEFRIDGNVVLDFSVNAKVNHYITGFFSINNLTNEAYVVARRPAGLRPGMPRSLLLGIKVNM